MENYVGVEFRIFVISVICGGISGVVFDLFRVKRRIKKCNYITVFVQDVLFWLINFIIVSNLIIASDNGIRFYIVIAYIIGFSIYFVTLSRFFMIAAMFVTNILKTIFGYMFKIILFPIFLVMKLLNKPILLIKLKIFKKISKIQLTLCSFCFKIKRKCKIVVKFLKKGWLTLSKSKKNKFFVRNNFGRVVICAFLLYFFIILCNQQITISQLENKKSDLKAQITEQENYNKKIKSQMTTESKMERVEKIAREKLGYMKSNERLFVDSSSK